MTLVEAGVDLEAREGSVYKKTALMVAAQKGHVDAVRALIQAGADPTAMSKRSEHVSTCRTALMFAEMRGHLEVAMILRGETAAKQDGSSVG